MTFRTVAVVAMTVLGVVWLGVTRAADPIVDTPQPARHDELAAEVAALKADMERLKGIGPDQSHAMADVGYHFANLWFAADNQNWPLADYYLSGTRSHLRWAVRIHPVRKTKAGAEIGLKGILDAVDNSLFTEIGAAITNKDSAKFKIAYRQTIEGCYACHKACEKPFLRPQVPNAASVSILNFDPNATWPE